jgi:hypothetical protein
MIPWDHLQRMINLTLEILFTDATDSTAVATITSSTCPGPVKRAPTDGKDDCPDAPIRGYLCELVNYACQCLNLPASTKKVTVTNTLVATAVVTKTIGSTTTVSLDQHVDERTSH